MPRATPGEPVGLIKVKTFRPFPLQAMVPRCRKLQAVGVVDRAVGFGWNCGPVFQETLAALYRTAQRSGRCIPAVSFIGGLSGADITEEHFARAITRTAQAMAGEPARRTGLAQRERLRRPSCHTANT